MLTHSGQKISLEIGAPTLRDIAVQLMRICRYAGACQRFWTVGLHSMAVADMLPSDIRHHGLLHDAGEVVIGDIPRPFKLASIKKLELEIELRIYSSLGIRRPGERANLAVKNADNRILSAEVWLFGPPGLTVYFDRDVEAEKFVKKYMDIPYVECLKARPDSPKDGLAVKMFHNRLVRAVRKARRWGG